MSGLGALTDTMVKTILPYADLLTVNFNMWKSGDTVICRSIDYTLKANFVDWEWDFGDGSPGLDIFGITGHQVSHYYQPAERDTTYTITLAEADQCFSAVGKKNVFVKGTGRIVKGTSFFPNPVENGYLNIESEKKDRLRQIRVIDLLGKQLDHITILDKPYGYYVLMDNLPEGIYIVQAIFEDEIINFRVLNTLPK
jgi:hypothetical protein